MKTVKIILIIIVIMVLVTYCGSVVLMGLRGGHV